MKARIWKRENKCKKVFIWQRTSGETAWLYWTAWLGRVKAKLVCLTTRQPRSIQVEKMTLWWRSDSALNGGIPSSKQRTHYYFRKIFHEKHLKRLAISLHCVYRSSSDKVPMNGGCELLIQTLKTGDLLGKKYLAFGKLFVSHKTYEIRTVFSNLDRIFQIWAKTFGKIITASFKSFGLSRDTLG